MSGCFDLWSDQPGVVVTWSCEQCSKSGNELLSLLNHDGVLLQFGFSLKGSQGKSDQSVSCFVTSLWRR